MKTKTTVKAGAITLNHNQGKAVRVKSAVKAGGINFNHNQTRA
jgi:hypothetical protein